jgi:outer membrane beta-barrel protein
MIHSLQSKLVGTGLVLIGLGATSTSAFAQDGPATEALSSFRSNDTEKAAVENRFFLKESRFEVSPTFGYIPNNPYARRYVGGLFVGYHVDESLAASLSLGVAPDGFENDLKELVGVLLQTARSNGDTLGSEQFEQPLEKLRLSFAAGLSWAPIYGKINIVGETVLNFDVYAFAGVGMISKQNYVATYDVACANPDDCLSLSDIVELTPEEAEFNVGPVLGLGQNYFINQSIALKLDVRSSFYVDDVPNINPLEEGQTAKKRLYNKFTTSIGVAIFFPKMKPRLYEF